MVSPITTLSQFQYESLRDCANSRIDNYLLIRPNRSDSPERQQLWSKNNVETDELVMMGLLADVSEEFSAQVEAHRRASGRVFRVFRITNDGKVMFNESSASASLN